MKWMPLLLLAALPLTAQADNDARFMGSGSCASSICHGGVGKNDNQYTLWSTQDRHSKAYDALFSDASKRMAKVLGLKEAHTDEFCLQCHGNPVASDRQGKRFDPHEGVSCERCHGAAEKWLEPHTRSGQTHAQNVRLGLLDNQNLTVRADNCLGCHSGLDHKVYSAGHPELTFELDTFSAIMPRHWEKKTNWEGARSWALGQAIGLSRQLQLIADHAKKGRLDESGMKCTSCHHNLFDVDWTVLEDSNGTPGWNAAHWIVFRNYLKLGFPDEANDLTEIMNKIGATFKDPKNPASEVEGATQKAKDILDDLTPEIGAKPLSAAIIRRLMEAIASEEEAYRRGGFRAAEQGVMALDALNQAALAEVGSHRWIPLNIKPLYDALDVNDPARYNAKKFLDALSQFRAKLTGAPQLPAGSDKMISGPDSKRGDGIHPKNLWDRVIETFKGRE